MPYKVPFVDVPKHFGSMEQPVMDAIHRVLSTGNLILRDDVRQFEKKLANYVGCEFAVGVNSGTDAVQFALRAAGLQPGDEVITVSHTCIATVAAVVNAGGVPVLLDVGDDFNIDVSAIEPAITKKTRFLLAVHLNGRASDMDAVQQIARKHNLIVIEDCAQALGAKYDGKMVGSMGVAGAFSLYPFKMMGAFGDAGAVVTNDPQIAKAVSMWRDYGEDRQTGEIHYYGFNSRLDNLHAAVLNVKFPLFPEVVRRRREIAEQYRKGLSGLPQVQLPHYPGEKFHDVFLNYTICVKDRDALVKHLKDQSVEPLTPISLVKPLHHHAALNLTHLKLPNTERIAREFIYLPIHPELTAEQVDYVVEAIRRYYGAA